MSKKCDISGKCAQRGNNVSHAHNKTRKTWGVNLQKKRLYDPDTGKWVRVRVSARALREIDKNGLEHTIRRHQA